MVLEGDSNPTRIDLPLLKAVARARRWSDDLLSGRVRSVDELARQERVDGRSGRAEGFHPAGSDADSLCIEAG